MYKNLINENNYVGVCIHMCDNHATAWTWSDNLQGGGGGGGINSWFCLAKYFLILLHTSDLQWRESAVLVALTASPSAGWYDDVKFNEWILPWKMVKTSDTLFSRNREEIN